MAIPQRNVTITGVFAENAATTIPAVPVAGTSYRDTNMTAADINTGWPYKTIVDSSQFNQAMYQYSTISKMQEVYGFLPWSNLTEYVEGSYCLGSDGVLYQAQQNTGPSSTAYNPVEDFSHQYWEDVIGKMMRIATPTGTILPFGGNSAPTGFLLCDGSAVSRTTYATLFAVIGTTYGSGDGSTTFNLPLAENIVYDVESNVPVKGNGKTLGLTDGTNNVGITISGSYDSAWRSVAPITQYDGTVGGAATVTYPSPANKISGLTTDASKSGIIGMVTRSVLTCKHIIKY